MIVGSSKYQWVCPKMDSQLASVLPSASLDVQNGSQCAEGSGPLTDVLLEPKEKAFPSTGPGNLQSCPVKAAVTIRNDALSINGKKPEAGVVSKPASQETSKIGGFGQPITVKTGVPVLQSQPITVKIVVPRGCKRPITNSTICLTKDLAHSHCKIPVLLSSGAGLTEENTIKSQMSDGEIKDVKNTTDTPKSTEEAKPESFHETEKDRLGNLWNGSTAGVHSDRSDTPLVSSTNTLNVLSKQGIKEETTEREIEESNSPILQEMYLKSCKTFDEMGTEEQTEPLDLSLPKKRESRERRCGRFLEDSGCESSLIMEVDEYEGEGDRDIVEEDEAGDEEDFMLCMDGTDTLENSLLSSSFFSTSVYTSLSSIDTENVLLIDDQGIPYTVSPDGLKMPQVDASISEDPQSDQANSAEVEGRGSPCLTSEADSGLSHSLDNSLNAPSDDLYPSKDPLTNALSLGGDQSDTPEVFTNSDPFKATEPNSKSVHANAVLPPSSGISVNTQPIPILTNSSTNAPIFLLPSSSSSPQLSSSPMSLTLPLSVTQTAPGTSTPMFLLLSSVPSSSSDSASKSTPVAVLDPTTGQLSQITAASAPVCFPLPSGQVSTLGSPMPTLSQPTIRLSPTDPPVILPGLNNVNATSVLASLAAQSSSSALQDDNSSMTALHHSKISSSNLNSGSEAISVEEVSNENNKPSTSTASSPHLQSATLTFDPLALPSSQVQSPAPEPHFDPPDLPSQHLPLDDHLYFSNSVAPPSPPIEPILPSSSVKPKPLDSHDPLDPLSSVTSPNTTNPRRVLYCQLCPRVFFYLSDLERHAITHSQKKPHVCHQCGKAFKRSSHLQRHKHIHTGQRNFVCPICTKRFREAGELQRHQRVHTGEKPYQCQLCHTRFAERNTLRRHTKRKHPYHQVAIEMLNERRGGGRKDEGGGGSRVQEEEESAEWYSSTVSNLENSESEVET